MEVLKMDVLKMTIGHFSETESEALKTAVDVFEEIMATAQEYNSIYHDAETAKDAIEMFIIKYVRNKTDVWFK